MVGGGGGSVRITPKKNEAESFCYEMGCFYKVRYISGPVSFIAYDLHKNTGHLPRCLTGINTFSSAQHFSHETWSSFKQRTNYAETIVIQYIHAETIVIQYIHAETIVIQYIHAETIF